MVSPTRPTAANRLLSALPDDDAERLAPLLDVQEVKLKQLLGRPGERIDNVYFPLDVVVSVLTGLEESTTAEIATIGSEGLLGVTVALGAETMNPRETAVVQVPGQVARLEVGAFREEIRRDGALTSLVGRYAQAFLSQVSQQVACNGLHSIEQRCARWLLLTHDRVGADEFPMTHEFLSQMLGVRRASVTLTAGIFQRAGFVEFHRGRMTVTDRAGLEGVACECYSVTREVFDRLFPEIPA